MKKKRRESTKVSEKKPRTSDEIQTEYMQLCAHVGELEYRKRVIELELNDGPKLNGSYQRLYELNIENAELLKTKPPTDAKY